MKVKLLEEPVVEFGNKFLCDDPKMGLTVGGFYSLTSTTHRSEIHFAIIGTKENSEDLTTWINDVSKEIKAEPESFLNASNESDFEIENGIVNVIDEEEKLINSLFENEDGSQHDSDDITFEVNKRVNPDFPGFDSESIFQCKFLNDNSNNRVIKNADIDYIVKKRDKNDELSDKETSQLEKAAYYCELLITQYKDILENFITTRPSICFIIIPDKVVKAIGSLSMGNKFFNLRRYIKAQLIVLPNAIPVQLIIESTLTRTGKRRLQDKSMVAWNFVNACYYKNEGTPWSLDIKDKNTCFIGISFNKVINSDNNNVRASIAQAFNYQGKGLVFIGKQFEWDSLKNQTPSPHLSYDYAKELISMVLKEYERFNRIKPTRVVIHKTTDFWTGAINPNFAETEGLKKGIVDSLGNDVEMDLVTVKSSKFKLLRNTGDYPVIRGTFLEVDRNYGVLYTTGYIPYYETYPGMHIPHPLDIIKFEGDTSITTLSEEILALTKLNFNNCNYYDSLPITIRFAQKVGEIIQYFDDDVTNPPNKYFYYM
ncbi:hypothetical protein VRU48_12045 [Pedobacter sp. KR3-3]|uniref:Protein argonaute n=1 Tax=Pedobacter albus TaxID=3113905 RepID=A0ABU7I8Q0_9SPHI|nr:hypothetical protein [Pedobacter sp. KR3-3]MEE1945843.1 hypothetical protein [Pedobacter sp. KR3-3]